MAYGLSAARRNGHRPGMPLPDVEGNAALTYCKDCWGYVCVDLAEAQEPYGSAVTGPCGPKGRRR